MFIAYIPWSSVETHFGVFVDHDPAGFQIELQISRGAWINSIAYVFDTLFGGAGFSRAEQFTYDWSAAVCCRGCG